MKMLVVACFYCAVVLVLPRAALAQPVLGRIEPNDTITQYWPGEPIVVEVQVLESELPLRTAGISWHKNGGEHAWLELAPTKTSSGSNVSSVGRCKLDASLKAPCFQTIET